MKSETTPSENPGEEDYVLKIELGLVFPLKAKADPEHAEVVAKSQELANMLIEHIKTTFFPAPEIMHILNGEAMKRSDYEDLKAQAKERAGQLAQMLQAIAGALPDGATVTAFGPNGEVVTAEASDADASAADQVEQQPAAAVVDAVEPGDKTFRVGPPRTLQ